MGRLFARVLACLGGAALALGAAGLSPVYAAGGGSWTCTGGAIQSGVYANVTVNGICSVPTGLVQVQGNLTIAPGALLDAMTPDNFFSESPGNLPGILEVSGNVTVQQGGVLFYGCDMFILCSPGNGTYPAPGLFPGTPFGAALSSSDPGDWVRGNVTGNQALGVVIHSVQIGHNFSINGGGGGPAELTGGPGSGACFDPQVVPVPHPWSDSSLGAIGLPPYTDIENSSVSGNVTIQNLQTCWLGGLRNKISGNLTDQNNLFGDPDANEILTNFIGGNMICQNNNAPVHVGDSGGEPNVVSGNAIGECADPTIAVKG